jgi:hypothetical protein
MELEINEIHIVANNALNKHFEALQLFTKHYRCSFVPVTVFYSVLNFTILEQYLRKYRMKLHSLLESVNGVYEMWIISITVEPRFTNAAVHKQFGSQTNFPSKKRLG